MWGLSSLSFPKKPTGLHTQGRCEGLNLVVEYATVVILDFGNSGPVELDADPSEPA